MRNSFCANAVTLISVTSMNSVNFFISCNYYMFFVCDKTDDKGTYYLSNGNKYVWFIKQI